MILVAQIKRRGKWVTVATFRGGKRGAANWFKRLLVTYRPTKPELRVLQVIATT